MRIAPREQRLYDLISRFQPYRYMSMSLLQEIPVHKLTLKRGEALEVTPGLLYVLLAGSASEIHTFANGREATLATFAPSQTIGWYPVGGEIRHGRATDYAVLAPTWSRQEALTHHRDVQMAERLKELSDRLTLQMTTSVTERLQYMPIAEGETRTDLARRLGCSREMVSRLLTNAGGRHACS